MGKINFPIFAKKVLTFFVNLWYYVVGGTGQYIPPPAREEEATMAHASTVRHQDPTTTEDAIRRHVSIYWELLQKNRRVARTTAEQWERDFSRKAAANYKLTLKAILSVRAYSQGRVRYW